MQKFKIEIESVGDTAYMTTNVDLSEEQRSALIKATVDIMNAEPADDEDKTDAELVENIDEDDAVTAVNMYRAALIKAIELFPDSDDAYISFIETAETLIAGIDPKFSEYFHKKFKDELEG